MASSQNDKAEAFRALHRGACFVIPNPWDAALTIRLAASLYRAAMAGLLQAAQEVQAQGTFGYVERL